MVNLPVLAANMTKTFQDLWDLLKACFSAVYLHGNIEGFFSDDFARPVVATEVGYLEVSLEEKMLYSNRGRNFRGADKYPGKA